VNRPEHGRTHALEKGSKHNPCVVIRIARRLRSSARYDLGQSPFHPRLTSCRRLTSKRVRRNPSTFWVILLAYRHSESIA